MPTTHEIVYDQAVRAVQQQVTQLDELRNRTAVLLAASGVVTGFMGNAAAARGFGAFGACAVVAFAASALCCIWVLLPRWDTWKFAVDANALIPFYLDDDEPETPEALHKYLAEKIMNAHKHNRDELGSLFGWFTAAAAGLAVEVVLWCLALALH